MVLHQGSLRGGDREPWDWQGAQGIPLLPTLQASPLQGVGALMMYSKAVKGEGKGI